jgi:DNA-binding MarR family transcriptional regulator
MERLKLDYLLIDSRPEINEENLFYMAIADVLMLVLCLDDQTFQGIAVTVDIARRLGVPKTLLVVNQLPSVFNAEEVQHQLEETFGESVAGVLPFSEEILQLAGRGVFSLQYPQHALTLEMQAIAYRLMHLDFSMPHTVPNLFTSEVLQQTANNIHVGLTMFEALNLPDSHRQIVNWVMRQGAASLQEIARSVGQSETNVSAILGILTEQGFIEPIDIQGQLCFRLRFTTKQNRQLSDKIWHPLQDDKPE